MEHALRTISLRPRVQPAEDCVRPTRAEIDLDALAQNLQALRHEMGRAGILAVVKADAYGHGVSQVATRLAAEGIDGFGVALAEEGLELREAGLHAPVLVLNGIHGQAHRQIVAAGLTPVLYDLTEARAFDRAAAGRRFGVHLKVDTGMARLGVPLSDLGRFLEAFEGLRNLRLDGLMTHLASAESDPAFTAHQLELFGAALTATRARGHRPRCIHVANSAAALSLPHARLTMVRPGIALFGHAPVPTRVSLRAAMRLRTEIVALRDLPANAPIGYGGTFRTKRPSRIATVAVGYGDGLLRATSNRGAMLVRGVRAPIAGTVSMDLTMLDVTDIPPATVGDEVVILGRQGHAEITAAELAQAAHTIPYEVLTNVSRRVPRFYRG